MPAMPINFAPKFYQNDLWDNVFDIISFPIYVVDVRTLEIVTVNATMRKYIAADKGVRCYEAIYRKKSACDFCKIRHLEAERIGTNTVFELFNDVDDRWYQLHETLVYWPDGRLVKHSTAVDITLVKESQSSLVEAHALLAMKSLALENASMTDSLTSLWNRRKLDQSLNDEIQHSIESPVPLSLMLIDLDGFKSINDTYGHQAGDRLLKEVALRLQSCVRNGDIVGRWGGEEFLVICPETGHAAATALAERLRRDIETFAFPFVEKLTASFGVTELDRSDSVEILIGRADAALYRAKAMGRNRIEVA